ncbi:phage tail protein [Kribbella sp. NPDC050820]|uniref:phage tail protein n=1 Tax=Kribbella sp. NPDC050820 TaxID=3155408 RepID=UPI0033D21A83
MATTGARIDPYTAFNFTLTIDGVQVGGFSEISGVNNENDKIDYREGAEGPTVRKLPGLKKFGDITLKRGYTTDDALWQWRKTVLDGKTVRHDGAIQLNDESNNKALRWEFTAAWPSKYSAPAFNAKTNEVAIEELVLQVENLVLA